MAEKVFFVVFICIDIAQILANQKIIVKILIGLALTKFRPIEPQFRLDPVLDASLISVVIQANFRQIQICLKGLFKIII